ncbi:Spy/CpxP family protein refolding chaperone [Phenylobacterium sp.]|uniref:Spy/CpxP family protein refolding chaperone n=1 Tax=Phenylobacterium sp. TaxID=1871053 RepID=UPI0035B12C41
MTYTTKLRPLILGAAILGAGLSAQAMAQPADGGRPAQAQGPMAGRDRDAMMAQRTERLRQVLQLRPDQEGAFNTFIAAMKPPKDARQAMRAERQEMASLTTPQRLDRMKAMMAQRQARFDQRAAATKRFYAQLTPAQQKAFDALPPMMDGPHGKHGGGEHRMGPMRGEG